MNRKGKLVHNVIPCLVVGIAQALANEDIIASRNMFIRNYLFVDSHFIFISIYKCFFFNGLITQFTLIGTSPGQCTIFQQLCQITSAFPHRNRQRIYIIHCHTFICMNFIFIMNHIRMIFLPAIRNTRIHPGGGGHEAHIASVGAQLRHTFP